MEEITSQYDELNREEVKKQYLYGTKNRLIRIYYYLKKGLELFNDFKYLGAGILALYFLLELDGYGKMILMGVVAVVPLTVVGYFWTHKAQKSVEYFNLKFTTHFGQYGIRLQEKQLKMLDELNKNIKEFNKGRETNK